MCPGSIQPPEDAHPKVISPARLTKIITKGKKRVTHLFAFAKKKIWGWGYGLRGRGLGFSTWLSFCAHRSRIDTILGSLPFRSRIKRCKIIEFERLRTKNLQACNCQLSPPEMGKGRLLEFNSFVVYLLASESWPRLEVEQISLRIGKGFDFCISNANNEIVIAITCKALRTKNTELCPWKRRQKEVHGGIGKELQLWLDYEGFS